jgi:hypothetical protein
MRRATKTADASALPPVGARIYLRIGNQRHPGVVLEHRLGGAWVEIMISGTDDPRTGLFTADELELAD